MDDKETKTFAVGERSISEIVADLAKEIPQSLLKTKKVKNTTLTFIPWYNATRLLDLYAPGWSYQVTFIEHIKNKVVLIAEISIPTSDGVITRQSTGNEDDQTSNYGDPFSNAESMALRRAAAKFGLGRYLYNK